MNTKMIWIGRGSALVLMLMLGAAPARADLIAQESFAATSGAINGTNGGTGWSGAWITGQSSAFVSAPAITGGPSIGATGGSLQITGSGRVFRVIDTSPTSAAAVAGLVRSHASAYYGTRSGIGAPGTTVWVAMIVSGGTGVSGDETQYHLYDGAGTDAAHLAMGDNNKDGEVVAMLRGGNVADWGFERTCSHSGCTAGDGYFGTTVFGGTHWSVTRFVFSATTTEITMWRDPTPGSLDPSDASALTLTPFGGGAAVQRVVVPALFFDTIAPNANGNHAFFVDEIRIATTFAELGGSVVGTDAGTPTVDAAMPGVDAAMPGVDAAMPRVDAAAADAGAIDATTRRDAGATAPSPSATCGCATSSTHGPFSVLLVLALVTWRRVRR